MATELFKSRSRRVGTEEQMEYVYKTSTLPDAIFSDPGIPRKGDVLLDRPWMTVIDIAAERITSNAEADYSKVTVTYSDHQELLQNPGDWKVEYDFMSRSENIRHAKQYIGAYLGPDGKYKRQYKGPGGETGGGSLFPVGQDLDSTAPKLIPHHMLRVLKLLDTSMLTAALGSFYSLQGVVNDADWKNYPYWTLLFHGAEVPQIGVDRYLATMTFEYDPTFHFYLWYVEDKKTRETSDIVYSERYVPGDFNTLGLGSPT